MIFITKSYHVLWVAGTWKEVDKGLGTGRESGPAARSCGIIRTRRTKMSEEKILTQHPGGKTGRNIAKQSYDTVKAAILAALKNQELTHVELMDKVHQKLDGNFSGNISWYAETVKLDLEARKTIERTSDKPQKYRMK
jgi:hypothetical protein